MSVQPAAVLGQLQPAAGHPVDGVGGKGLNHHGQPGTEAVAVIGNGLRNAPGGYLGKGDGPRVVDRQAQIGLGQGRAEVLGHLVKAAAGGRKE